MPRTTRTQRPSGKTFGPPYARSLGIDEVPTGRRRLRRVRFCQSGGMRLYAAIDLLAGIVARSGCESGCGVRAGVAAITFIPGITGNSTGAGSASGAAFTGFKANPVDAACLNRQSQANGLTSSIPSIVRGAPMSSV